MTSRLSKIKTKKKGFSIKFAVVFLLFTFILTGLYLGITHLCKVTDIRVYGNQRVRYEDIVSVLKVDKGDRLFETDLKTLHERLMTIRWIKKAVVKKDLTGVIHIKIKETEAVAILRLKERVFLVDPDGVLLEDIGDAVAFFLPVLVDIDPKKDYMTYKEALSFVSFLKNHSSYANKGKIEITGKRPEDITAMIEGIQIKVGSGDYDKKLSRLDFVRREIQRRNLNVEVIDVRFKDRVVVRTSKEDNDKVILEKEKR